MPFYRTIFDSGCWMECTQSAQAIYPVMRTYSFTDADLYAELENLEEVGYDNFYPGNIRGEDDHYRNRRYDFCITPFEVLSEYSGISDPRTIKKAVADLETNFLVEYIGKIFATEETGFEPTPTWAVYRHPIQIFKREYLNEKITKRYKAYENHKHKYLLN